VHLEHTLAITRNGVQIITAEEEDTPSAGVASGVDQGVQHIAERPEVCTETLNPSCVPSTHH
jgi:hypothetical protein